MVGGLGSAALGVALSWDGPRTSKTVVAAPALRNDLRLRGLNRLRMFTVTMMRYSVRNGNREAYDQPMWARFGLRCLAALLTVPLTIPLTAQQGASPSLETLLKDGDALSKQADYAHAIPLLQRAKQLDPQDYRTNLLLGLDLLRSGHPSVALEPLRTASQA